jgi:RecB family exonuclease
LTGRFYHLDQLAALCQAHPGRTKVVFVPSLQAGDSLAVALARAGQGWANLHLVTPEAWISRSVVRGLEAEGWRPLLTDHDLPQVEELLGRLPKSAGTALPDPRLAPALLRALHDLRQAGIDPAALAVLGSKSFVAPIYRGYLAFLQEHRLHDLALRCERATAAVRSGREAPVYAILDEVILGEVVYQYLCRETGGRLHRIGRNDYGIPPPRQSAAARFSEAPFPVPPGRVGRAGQVFSDVLTEQDRDRIRLAQVTGPEGEVDWILRDLLSHRYPLDTVEVAYTADRPYLVLLHDLAERFGLSITFASGLPPDLTRPGQALTGFLGWIASGLEVDELIALCQARLVSLARAPEDEAGDPTGIEEIAGVLRAARLRPGRGSYRVGLERLARGLAVQRQQYQEEGRTTGHLEDQSRSLEQARLLVDQLLTLAPEGGRTTVRSLAQGGVEFLARHKVVLTETDRGAVKALTALLHTAGDLVDHEGPVDRVARYLIDLSRQSTVQPRGPRPGHLHVVPLDRAGYAQRSRLYVIGMDEGCFPGRGVEDPVLLDAERRRLSPALPLQRARPGERVWHLLRLLGMTPGEVILVSRRRSLADDGETYPAALFQHLATCLGTDEEELPVEPVVPSADALFLTRGEAMVATRNGQGYEQAVGRVFPLAAAGRAADATRQQPGLGRFHGWLGRPTPELDLGRGDLAVSTSRLECLTRCPYRYFLRHVLRLELPEEWPDDPGRWLHPIDFGRLVHALFCDFMTEVTRRGERPDPALHGDLLQQLLDRRVEEYRGRVPVLHQAALKADLQSLTQAARVFLSAEAGRPGVEPAGFEISFGFGHAEGLSRPEPVLLRLGDQVRLLLRGYIDRVDRTGAGYELWDYKTGSPARYVEDGLLERAEHLQWILYAYALEEILRDRGLEPRIHRSGYFFTSEHGYGRRVAPPLPRPAELADRLGPLLALAAAGRFPQLQKTDQCSRCDYAPACDQRPLQAAGIEAAKAAATAEERAAADLMEAWLRD